MGMQTKMRALCDGCRRVVEGDWDEDIEELDGWGVFVVKGKGEYESRLYCNKCLEALNGNTREDA